MKLSKEYCDSFHNALKSPCMKNLSLLALLLIFALSLSAQSKFHFGAAYFPNYSWQMDHMGKDAYSPGLSHTAGMTISYPLGAHWSISSGLAYANINQKHELDVEELRWGIQHDGNGGFDPGIPSGEDIIAFSFQHTYHFVEVPLRLTYISNGNRLRFYASAGLAPRFFITDRSKSTVERDNGNTEENTYSDEIYKYNRIQLGLLTACGIELDLGQKAMLFAGPRLQIHRFGGESEQLDHSFTADFMQLGLEMGVRLR